MCDAQPDVPSILPLVNVMLSINEEETGQWDLVVA